MSRCFGRTSVKWFGWSRLQIGFEGASDCPELDTVVSATLNAAKDLSRHLASAALQQAQELNVATKHSQELVTSIRQQALLEEPDRFHHTSDSFHDSIDHILEVGIIVFFVGFYEGFGNVF